MKPKHIKTFTEIIDVIEVYRSKPLVLIIDGRAGSGKTTLAKQILGKYSGSQTVPLDSFHFSANHTGNEKYDYHRLIDEVITPFKENKFPIKYQKYNFGLAKGLDYDGLDEWVTVEKSEILIIEGFSASKLADYADLSIWVESDPKESMDRANKRNVEEYGLKPMSNLAKGTWLEGQENWISVNTPMDKFSLIYTSDCNHYVKQ